MQFLGYTVIGGCIKLFQVETEMPSVPLSSGHEAYKAFKQVIEANLKSFGVAEGVDGFRVSVTDLIAFSAETPLIKEFFTFTEL